MCSTGIRLRLLRALLEMLKLGGSSLTNLLRISRSGFVLVWPWKAPRRSIRSKEAIVLPTGPCFMTQIRVRSGVVARRMSSQGDLANICMIEVARREAVHGKEKEVPAPTRSLAIARGRAASSAHVLASQVQASSCLDGLQVLMQKAASLKTAPRPEAASASKDVVSPLRVDVGSTSNSPLQGITMGMASLSLEDAPKERVASAPPVRKGEVHVEPEFLPNSRIQEVLVDALQRMPKADVVFVAYSFDGHPLWKLSKLTAERLGFWRMFLRLMDAPNPEMRF